VTPRSINRSAITCNERVIVEYDLTSWTRREPPLGSGTRTTHQLGLANIQGCDALDDLLFVLR